MKDRLPHVFLLTLLLLIRDPALADIAVIVNPHNPVATLTPDDLQKIFLGRMPLFPQTDREIHAIDLPDSSTTFAAFYRRVVKLDGVRLKRYRAYYLFSGRGRLPEEAQNQADVIDRVSRDETAIGYVDCRKVTEAVRVLMVLPDKDEPADP